MPRRQSPLKRGQPPKRKSRIKPKKRTPAEYARIYGSRARVKWVKSLVCAACGFGSPCENHHIETGGTGRKADFTKIIPLCLPCHGLWHQFGRQAFEASWGLDADLYAASVERAWLLASGARQSHLIASKEGT